MGYITVSAETTDTSMEDAAKRVTEIINTKNDVLD